MKIIRGADINEAYVLASHVLMNNAEYACAPRGMAIKECLNTVITITDPYKRIVTLPERALSMHYLAGEFAFYLSGSDALGDIVPYSKFWNKVSDDGVRVNSAYGKRLMYVKHNAHTQFEYALEQLLLDPDTRKATMQIYEPADNKIASKDNPCTMDLQFFIRNNALHLTVHMRSNDIWFGLPYDVAFFTFIQEKMLVALNTVHAYESPRTPYTMGAYTHIVGSFHVYEKDFEKVGLIANRLFERGAVIEQAGEMPRYTEHCECNTASFLAYESLLRNGANVEVIQDALSDITEPFYLYLVDLLNMNKEVTK